MRLLQLTAKPPFPPIDGGRAAMLHLFRGMQSAGAQVHILSLDPGYTPEQERTARAALAPMTFQSMKGRLRHPLHALRETLRTGHHPFVARFHDRVYASRIESVLQAGPVDCIQIESIFLVPYVDLLRRTTDAPLILRAPNVEHQLWDQWASCGRNPLQGAFRRRIAESLRKFEISHLNDCDAVVPISDADAADLRALGCVRPLHVARAPIALPPALPPPVTAPRAGFLGALDYRPNADAVLWLAGPVRDALRSRSTDVELHIAGSGAPKKLIRRLVQPGIRWHGEVPDAAAYLASMAVVVAPVFSGGGVRIKILEAMALGKAVITTTFAAASLGARNGEELLLADHPGAFAEAVAQLIREPGRAAAIGRSARAFVERHHDPLRIARDLLRFYEQLISA